MRARCKAAGSGVFTFFVRLDSGGIMARAIARRGRRVNVSAAVECEGGAIN
jgi:hypothetical protein